MVEPCDWTNEDKRQFLAALREVGDSNLETLCHALPSKSMLQVRNMIDHYKGLAQTKWLRRKQKDTDDLQIWIDVLVKLSPQHLGLIQGIIPRVLKYIAMYEKRAAKSDIELSEAYKYLSQLCEGKPKTKLSDRTGYFVYQVLIKLAEELQKNKGKNEAENYFQELHNLQELQSKSAGSELNPLAVPPRLLQPDHSVEMKEYKPTLIFD